MPQADRLNDGLAAQLKAILQTTQQTVASAMQVTPEKPQTLTDPLDTVIGAMPNVFAFIAQQGVTVSQDSLNEYQTAANLYMQDRPLCLQNSDNCLALQDVITHLDTMRTDITQTLQDAGRTDLESQIDLMLQ